MGSALSRQPTLLGSCQPHLRSSLRSCPGALPLTWARVWACTDCLSSCGLLSPPYSPPISPTPALPAPHCQCYRSRDARQQCHHSCSVAMRPETENLSRRLAHWPQSCSQGASQGYLLHTAIFESCRSGIGELMIYIYISCIGAVDVVSPPSQTQGHRYHV